MLLCLKSCREVSFEKTPLLCSKGDLFSLQDRVEKMDLDETCAQERATTKWRYALTTNVTVFCVLLNNSPMGCLDAVVPEKLKRRSDVNCLVTNGYGETYIFLYDIDIDDGDFLGELARCSLVLYETSINLLRYSNHIWFADDINTFFKRLGCPNGDIFKKRADKFHHHGKSCIDRIQHVYPKSVYTLRETLFDKTDGFGIIYEEDQNWLKNLAVFDFQSICVPSNELKGTKTTTCIGKLEPISVSILEPIFLCNKGHKTLIVSFFEALEEIASKLKAEILQKLSSIENLIKTKVNSIFEKLNERKNESTSIFEFQYIEEEESDLSTQFLQFQKNHFLNYNILDVMLALHLYMDSTARNVIWILSCLIYCPSSFTSAIFSQP